MEILNPLRNWLGSTACKILLDWWDDLTSKEQSYITDKLCMYENESIHSFTQNLNGKEILQHINKNEYYANRKWNHGH